MRSPLLAFIVLAGACTTTSLPDEQLHGTFERTGAGGQVLEQMSFFADGTFTATAPTNPERPQNFWDLRDVHGYYATDEGVASLRGRTTDGVRYEIDFTYYVDDGHFVRGAFLLNDTENPHTPLVRDFHALHARSFDQTHDRELRVGLNLVESGDEKWYGASFVDPIFLSADGEGGPWTRTADGAGLLLDVGLRYEVFGGEGMTALGRIDHRPASLDAPANLWDTAYIFERTE